MIPGRFRIDILLLTLFIAQIVVDLPFFLGIVNPLHDTTYAFHLFYFTYNDFYIFGELPRWVPFGFYGVQSDYFVLLPTDYLALFIGRAIGITNALTAFKLSIFFSQSIFLYGTYLLSKRLFTKRAAIFCATFIVICGTVPYYQIHFNFLVYIYLPIIFFFLHKYFTDFRPWALVAAACALIFSVFGLGIYLITLNALVCATFFAVLAILNCNRWRGALSITRRDLIVSGLFLLAFAFITWTLYSFTTQAMSLTEGVYIGRDPLTKAAPLHSFLTYGEYAIGFKKFVSLVFLSAEFVMGDVTIHVGHITLLFVVVAVVFVRRPAFYALAAVVVLLTLFSLGRATPVAEFLYHYFPTMKYFRHIGYSVTNFKLVLPLMAGFGLDWILTRLDATASAERVRKDALANVVRILVAITFIAGGYIYASASDPGRALMWAGLATAFTAMLYLIGRCFRRLAPLGVFVALCVVVQMSSYRVVVDAAYYRSFWRNAPPEASVMVNRYDFQAERTEAPEIGGRSAKTFVHVLEDPLRYSLAYNFIQWDPCISTFRTDFLSVGVANLLSVRNAAAMPIGDTTSGKRFYLPYDDGELIRAVGCLAPKLRLHPEAIMAKGPEDAAALVRTTRAIDLTPVIEGAPQGLSRVGDDPALAMGPDGVGTVRVSDFSANGLTVEADVASPGGSWLYYADAWHPGWRAYVNGKEAPINRANLAFKAVWLEAGRHTVRFVFNDQRSTLILRLMIAIDLIFVITILAFICRSIIFRRPEAA